MSYAPAAFRTLYMYHLSQSSPVRGLMEIIESLGDYQVK